MEHRNFAQQDSGAVTVDWVVLTAGLVGLGLATLAVVSAGVQDTAQDVEDQLSNDIITTAFATEAADFDWMAYSPNAWNQDGYNGYRAAWSGGNNPDEHLRTTITNNLVTLQGYIDQGQTMGDAQAATYADMIGAHMSILSERGVALPVTDPELTDYMTDIGAIPSE